MSWDAFPLLPAESTTFTTAAHEYAIRAARERFVEPRFASDGTELRILPHVDARYVAVVLGQPASQSGMQGANPERIRYMREEMLSPMGHPYPVWLTFIQGSGAENATTVWSGWLHTLPAAKLIAKDPAAKRFGWPCAALDHARALTFPEAVPPAPALAGLF